MADGLRRFYTEVNVPTLSRMREKGRGTRVRLFTKYCQGAVTRINASFMT
jgi:hypothetical protein